MVETGSRTPVAAAHEQSAAVRGADVGLAHAGAGAVAASDGGAELVRPSGALVHACEEFLQEQLTLRRQDEFDRGLTLIGPQRHDLILELDQLEAKSHASHGESWSIALALRLASLTLLQTDDDPVLILDDVFAELDAGRRRRLVSLVSNIEQVLVTTAAVEDVPDGLQGTTFHVTSGSVIPA